MWLSKQSVNSRPEERIYSGNVTLSGENTGVYTDAERREILLYTPGGYFWRPETEQNMIVIKNAEGENCAVGTEMIGAPEGLQTGEVYIRSNGGAYIWLKGNGIELAGNLEITGQVNIKGSLTVNGNQIC